MSRNNLLLAFEVFDKDGNGVITAEEIRDVLSDDFLADEKVWEDIIQEVDSNGDGMIDLKEFLDLMNNKLLWFL